MNGQIMKLRIKSVEVSEWVDSPLFGQTTPALITLLLFDFLCLF